MRAGEIFNLSLDQVNLKEKAIKLKGVDTKTLEPGVILNQALLAILDGAGRSGPSSITGSLGIRGSL